ncbi:MAG: glycosyltransferase family 1 protein [Candidatus Aenigmatarchaeota archaeon]
MVLLIVPSLDVPKFKGIARISSELIKRVKYEEIFEVYGDLPLIWDNLIKVPLKELLSTSDIVHSLVPESASFLPFIPWKKTIVTFHDFIPFEFGKKFRYKFSSISEFYTKAMWRLASKCKIIIANSSQTAEEVKKYFNRKSIIIPPGVDKKFKPKRIEKEKVTLGFFSNFSIRKGVDKAIEVFKILKKKIDCKLILAGGTSPAFFQTYIDKQIPKNLKDIVILGNIEEEKLVDLYNSFDFFIFPSLYEGFGLPIIEAQACGIPTLILRDAKIPKETRKKAIACKDPTDMVKKILELTEDKKKYKYIAKEGMKYAKKFTWENFARQHEKIYESVGHR